MILNPILRVPIFPTISSWVKQSRNIRPTVRIAKDKFQLIVDVHQFNKEEIKVKARQEYVIIEGKQAKKSKNGYVIRQFTRKFKLPSGCLLDTMESRLSPDGLLTITAPRKQILSAEDPCETYVPIQHSGPRKIDDNIGVEGKLEEICKSLKKPTNDEKGS